MSTYSKYNIIYRLQKWMDSVPGQTFLNYAYSWGAAIVIFGTLCKLTHIPGANFWLFLGMGTEVVVFFLSAFDRPFDKTAEGRELPSHVSKEYLEGGAVAGPSVAGNRPTTAPASTASAFQAAGSEAPVAAASAFQPVNRAASVAPSQPVEAVNVASRLVKEQSLPGVVPDSDMAEAQKNYVEELRKLTEMLEKVGQQSRRLTRDSEEMENLNRTLTGICKVYEMQLRSASSQIDTIDRINEQSKLMAKHIEQLNTIYARMIEAMTVNMRSAAPGVVDGANRPAL